MKSIQQKKDETGLVVETKTIETDTEQNSVKVAKNGKGEFSWEMKVYGKTDEDIRKELEKFRKVVDEQAQ